MVHIVHSENSTNKPTMLTSVQTTQASIIKEIPRSIEKRLSILSSSKNIFQESIIYHEKCPKTVNIKLIYNINNQEKTIKTKRKENATLFDSTTVQEVLKTKYSSN